MTIRRMEAPEAEDVVAVWERARLDAQPWLEERMGYSHEDNVAFFRGTIMREYELWVAQDEGPIAAFLALSPGTVEYLYVDPPVQGSGVGTALLDHAKAAWPRGLRLFTHQRNERARAFYERRGFRAVALGVSPAPESEPDVEYLWAGARPPAGVPAT
jgi:ribosomal protein S18 acetylase RimI-like enzyme